MGRPKLFGEQQVLSAAMLEFWKKGYRGTSTEDLCRATKLKPGSIYHQYQDKTSLFCRALEFYLDTIVAIRVSEMLDHENPTEGIEYFFSSAFESVASTELIGCLLTNSALDGCTEERRVKIIVNRGFRKIEKAFEQRISEAIKIGDLSSGVEPAATAIQLLTCFQGLMINSRLTKNKKRLHTITQQTMRMLLQQPDNSMIG